MECARLARSAVAQAVAGRCRLIVGAHLSFATLGGQLMTTDRSEQELKACALSDVIVLH